ncbi:50S ribosomal protein L24 [Candidatus Pacearchaeota archaeon]|nr:50S ribosomal protein L24 [Candidatus Pacearchaeota archaeon]
MKSEFNKSWNSSKQPRKQVKFRANAPNHIKKKFMGSTLDKALREKYGRRSISVRNGDEVKIMRGKFKGKQGKVGIVDIKNTRIQVDGIQRVKSFGGEKLITWFHPSNVKIIILDVSDEKRLKSSEVEKTSATEKKDKKKTEEIKKEVGKTKKAVKKTTNKEKK